jgi:CRP-like cAMP-binding protein
MSKVIKVSSFKLTDKQNLIVIMQQFWDKVESYATLSEQSKEAWSKILRKKSYIKDQYFILEGEIGETVAFVVKGLFSKFHTTEEGDVVIKRFFFENFFVASTSSMLSKTPSLFSIRSLEPGAVFEYNFQDFKMLTKTYPDIAAFYIRYMELHWIIEKEPLEISFRHDTAKVKYADFLKTYPSLESRLKLHEIAAYLGITPTQLSRIRAEK